MDFGRVLRNRPRMLEFAYRTSEAFLWASAPVLRWVGVRRVERVMTPVEEFAKKIVFDCRMCGQCVLHSTGMTCPMTCPKNIRNGPCGGVRPNGHCEVFPDKPCIWVEAFERSNKMRRYGHEITLWQKPVAWNLQGRSAWITQLTDEAKIIPLALSAEPAAEREEQPA
jgi:hypothetical protein